MAWRPSSIPQRALFWTLAALAAGAGVAMLAPGASAWTGGPDGCGYTGIDSQEAGGPLFAFTDITTTGTSAVGAANDDGSDLVTIPFPFQFCGRTYTQVRIVSNGELCFVGAPSSACSNYMTYPSPIPTWWNNQPAVYGYASDLYPPGCQGGGASCVKHEVQGTAPNRVFMYMEKGVPLRSWSTSPVPYNRMPDVTFEIKLFEADNCIEVHIPQASDPERTHYVLSGIQETNTWGLNYFHAYSPNAPSVTARAVRYCQTVVPAPICQPAVQNVIPNQAAAFSVMFGVAPFTWTASGGTPASGAGSAFSTAYSSIGSRTVTVTDGRGLASNCSVNVTAPPCDYVFTSIPYNFTEISATGTRLNHWISSQIDVTLPWVGYHCGLYSDVLRTAASGHVCFGSTDGSCWVYWPHSTLPVGSAPNAVYGYWTPFYVGQCLNVNPGSPNCGTKWQVLGTPPNRVFVYEFKDVPIYNYNPCGTYCAYGANTFEMKFFETTACWETHYQSVVPQSMYNAVAGLENPAGSLGYTWRNEPAPGFAAASQAWRACPPTIPPPPPPVCTPATQSAAPGPVTFTALPGRGVPPFAWSVSGPGAATPATGTGASFTPAFTVPGTYTVTLSDSQPQSSACTVAITVPGCGYVVNANHDYDWTEIDPAMGGGGTGLGNLGSYNFYYYYQTYLLRPSPPMNFPFCGGTHNDFFLSGSGMICLGNTALPAGTYRSNYPSGCGYGWFSNPIPSTATPNNVVYGLRAPYYSYYGCNGVRYQYALTPCVFYKVEGTPGSRILVYEFKGVAAFFDFNALQTFQVKLHEASGCIEVHYKNTSGASFPYYPSSSGYENAAGTNGYQFFYSPYYTNPPALANRAWLACPFGAMPDTVTINEDRTTLINVAANDNGDGESFEIVGFTQPVRGSASGPDAGVFAYDPPDDFNGVDTFDYTIRTPSGKTSTGKVTVRVNAVNDAPQFTADLERIRTSPIFGPYVHPGWATGVRGGPTTATDEAGQGVTFEIESNSFPAIFASPPRLERTMSATATEPPIGPSTGGAFAVLRFEPSGLAGRSTVCFRARDTGGTALATSVGVSPPQSENGVNASPPQCVEIEENGPPYAYFVPSTPLAAPGEGVTLDSCPDAADPAGPYCSHDPDGYLVDWEWSFGDGATGHGPAPIHAYAAPGTYVVRLVVVDDATLRDFAVGLVHVAWPGAAPVEDPADGSDVPPVADAGADLTVVEGTLVQLEGGQKGANEHATFQWLQSAGPGVALRDEAAARPSFAAPMTSHGKPVQLQFQLVVSNGALTSAPDYAVVTVVPREAPPVAIAGGTVHATAGALVGLDGSASGAGHPGLAYEWRQVLGPAVALAGADTATPTFTAPAEPGQLKFRLTVSNDAGTSQDEAVVFVQPVEAPPLGARMAYEVRPSGDGADVEFVAVGLESASWDFGDGQAAEGRVVVHHYAAGAYDVTMQVGDAAHVERIAIAGPEAKARPAAAANAPAWIGGLVAALALVAVVSAAVLVRRASR